MRKLCSFFFLLIIQCQEYFCSSNVVDISNFCSHFLTCYARFWKTSVHISKCFWKARWFLSQPLIKRQFFTFPHSFGKILWQLFHQIRFSGRSHTESQWFSLWGPWRPSYIHREGLVIQLRSLFWHGNLEISCKISPAAEILMGILTNCNFHITGAESILKLALNFMWKSLMWLQRTCTS